jgi:uncharacterized membrane protein YjdF
MAHETEEFTLYSVYTNLSTTESKVSMMEIFIPVVLIVEAFLMELSAWRPSALIILNKMTNLFRSFVYLPLKVG